MLIIGSLLVVYCFYTISLRHFKLHQISPAILLYLMPPVIHICMYSESHYLCTPAWQFSTLYFKCINLILLLLLHGLFILYIHYSPHPYFFHFTACICTVLGALWSSLMATGFPRWNKISIPCHAMPCHAIPYHTKISKFWMQPAMVSAWFIGGSLGQWWSMWWWTTKHKLEQWMSALLFNAQTRLGGGSWHRHTALGGVFN